MKAKKKKKTRNIDKDDEGKEANREKGDKNNEEKEGKQEEIKRK